MYIKHTFKKENWQQEELISSHRKSAEKTWHRKGKCYRNYWIGSLMQITINRLNQIKQIYSYSMSMSIYAHAHVMNRSQR